MLSIDRIEGRLAVCEQEDGTMISVDVSAFVPCAQEGGVYEFASGKWFYNETETNRRREEAAALLAELFGEDSVEE